MQKADKTFKELMADGYELLWPIRIVSICTYGDFIFSYGKGRCIKQLGNSALLEMKKHIDYIKSRNLSGNFLFAQTKKGHDGLTNIMQSDGAKEVFEYCGFKEESLDNIICFMSDNLIDVELFRGSEKEAHSKLTEIIYKQSLGLFEDVLIRKPDNSSDVQWTSVDSEGNKSILGSDDIRYCLAEEIIRTKGFGSFDTGKSLLVTIRLGNISKGFYFRDSYVIDKIMKDYLDVTEKQITCTVNTHSTSKGEGIHAESLAESLSEIDVFCFTISNSENLMTVKEVISPPFDKSDEDYMDSFEERLSLILELVSIETSLGFSYDYPKIYDYRKGLLTCMIGNTQYRPSLSESSLKTVLSRNKAMLSGDNEITEAALEGINKSRTESNQGSRLKTLWATIEDVFYSKKDPSKKKMFDKDTLDAIASTLNDRGCEEKEIHKIKSKLGEYRLKTRNDVIKETICKLYAEDKHVDIKITITEAFKLRGHTVHGLKKQEEYCKKISSKLERFLEDAVVDKLGH